MNKLEKLIEAERKKANAKIAKLRRDAAAEQRRIDDRLVALLREHHCELHEQLAAEAVQALADEKLQRSKRAKDAAQQPRSKSIEPDPQTDGAVGREGASWNE